MPVLQTDLSRQLEAGHVDFNVEVVYITVMFNHILKA